MSLEYIKVASINEIPLGFLKKILVRDKAILLANIKGKYYAMGAICTHKQCELSDGVLDQDKETVICSCHGAVFDLKTGEGIFRKSIEKEPVYEVLISGSDILVKV